MSFDKSVAVLNIHLFDIQTKLIPLDEFLVEVSRDFFSDVSSLPGISFFNSFNI